MYVVVSIAIAIAISISIAVVIIVGLLFIFNDLDSLGFLLFPSIFAICEAIKRIRCVYF